MSATRRGARRAPAAPAATEVVTRVNAVLGASVSRGPSWSWEAQDGGAGLPGTIVSLTGASTETSRWLQVAWVVSGQTNSYRVGHGGAHDLVFADSAAVSHHGSVVSGANAAVGLRVRPSAGAAGLLARQAAGGPSCAGTVTAVEAPAPTAAPAPAPPARASRRRTRADMEAGDAPPPPQAVAPAPAPAPSAGTRITVSWDTAAPGAAPSVYTLPPPTMQSNLRFPLRTLPADGEAAAAAAAAEVRAQAGPPAGAQAQVVPPAVALALFAGRVVTLAEALPGLRVVRGPSWQWEAQDGGSAGTVVHGGEGELPPGWVFVRWDAPTTSVEAYRVGELSGAFDLAHPPADAAPPPAAPDAAAMAAAPAGGRRTRRGAAAAAPPADDVISAGDLVTVVDDFLSRQDDAARGPLGAGAVGRVAEDDGSGLPYRVEPISGHQGRAWWYRRGALRRVAADSAVGRAALEGEAAFHIAHPLHEGPEADSATLNAARAAAMGAARDAAGAMGRDSDSEDLEMDEDDDDDGLGIMRQRGLGGDDEELDDADGLGGDVETVSRLVGAAVQAVARGGGRAGAVQSAVDALGRELEAVQRMLSSAQGDLRRALEAQHAGTAAAAEAAEAAQAAGGDASEPASGAAATFAALRLAGARAALGALLPGGAAGAGAGVTLAAAMAGGDEAPQAALPDPGAPVTRANVALGLRVVRGIDWQWAEQDGGPGGVGSVTRLGMAGQPSWVAVAWDGGGRYTYRVGAQGAYDLCVAPSQDPPAGAAGGGADGGAALAAAAAALRLRLGLGAAAASPRAPPLPPPPPRFAIGHRVRLASRRGPAAGVLAPGDIGTVVDTDTSALPLCVAAADGRRHWYAAAALERVPGDSGAEDAETLGDAAAGASEPADASAEAAGAPAACATMDATHPAPAVAAALAAAAPRDAGPATDLATRCAFLCDAVAAAAGAHPGPQPPPLVLVAARGSVLRDSMTALGDPRHGAPSWRAPLVVHFASEGGVDSGGLTREWFGAVAAAAAQLPCLSPTASDGAYELYFSAAARSPADVAAARFLGALMGKALMEGGGPRGARNGGGLPLRSLRLALPLFKHLAGEAVPPADYALLDPAAAASLRALASGAVAAEAVGELYFVAEPEGAGGRSFELRPGGRHTPLCDANRAEYAAERARWALTGGVAHLLAACCDGFYSLVPRAVIDALKLDGAALKLAVCGAPVLDLLGDVRQHTSYGGGYSAKHAVIKWLWAVLKELSEEQRASFWTFCTGGDGLPPGGAAALRPRFCVRRVARDAAGARATAVQDGAGDGHFRLMTAHTCFRALDLPEYASKGELRTALLTAITHGVGSFEFA